jgi:5-methylcytosine-specific restriction endonuclease McrBC GTP-binding regulatory subunit McrB
MLNFIRPSVGVEQEEAGEKWRAGDAAKSMRFFMRAIATYDEGLKRHPQAFDLAYNKYVQATNDEFGFPTTQPDH